MTTDQWFAVITLSFTAAFTALLLSFAWRAIRIWRAEKGKTKRIEAAIDETDECLIPEWEGEIHRINRDHADKIMNAQERHVEIVAELKQQRLDELFDLRERRKKEEGGADETTQQVRQ